jgi:hypothetical protein
MGWEGKDFVRHLRKGTGADTTASDPRCRQRQLQGQVRAPLPTGCDLTNAAQPGRLANADELDRLGPVAAPEFVA